MNQCSSNLALEIYIKDVTKLHVLCCCHDNPFAAGPVLIKYEIPSCGLPQGPFTPLSVMIRVLQYVNHVCSKFQDPLSYLKRVENKDNWFLLKRVSMTRTLWVLFGFCCDVHFWCQVWRTLLQYFQRYSLFSILPF